MTYCDVIIVQVKPRHWCGQACPIFHDMYSDWSLNEMAYIRTPMALKSTLYDSSPTTHRWSC